MRRLFLCLLLCLLPLRLWAGVWMSLSDSGAHHLAAPAHLSLTQATETDAVHDCHGAAAGTLHEAQVQPQVPLDTAVQKTDCHDGTCQLCGVCHQSANLAVWPRVAPVAQAHPLPPGVSMAPAAHLSAPLTKPPIS